MPIELILMSSDYYQPFVVVQEDGEWDLVSGEEVQELFGVPEHVFETFRPWCDTFRAALNAAGPWGLGWKTPEEEQQWMAQGRPMTDLFAAHVPDGVTVRFGF